MPETFSPIIWRNNQAPAINENNLNRLEQGVEAIDDRLHTVELGVVTPVTVGHATSVTLNATQGSLFRCIATGDLTLDDIVGGIDGQTIVFEVQASGAARTLAFTGSTDSIEVAAGQWWIGTFRYVAIGDTWVIDDNSGGGGSGSGGGNDLNILAPQNVPYAGTVTLDAASGALFRIVAPGNLTLADPVNGTDGQAVVIEVIASGGQRMVAFSGGSADPVTIPTGARWIATLRYHAGDNVWLLADAGGGGGSGGVAGVSSVNNLTGTVVLDADDLADGSTNVMMTANERSKLGGVATGATANATDAQLRSRATHTGTQPVSSLTTTGTANAKTYLRGDAVWASPLVIESLPRTTSYTITAADAGVEQIYNSTSPGTFTLPTNAAQAIAVGTSIPLRQSNTGQLTVAAAAGATLQARNNAFNLAGQHAVAEVRKVATDTWVLFGDIAV